MIEHATLVHLVKDRARAKAIRDQATEDVDRLNAQLLALLQADGVKHHQMLDGTIVQVISPNPRTTIVGELLLGQGVAPEVIKQATLETPVSLFIRVDAPRVAKGALVDGDTGQPVPSSLGPSDVGYAPAAPPPDHAPPDPAVH